MRVTTCNMRHVATAIALLNMALFASTSVAEDKPKGPSCQDQLAQTSVQANNLVHDRALKEEALAKEQIANYILKQKVSQLEATIAAMKKSAEPNGEPKKAE